MQLKLVQDSDHPLPPGVALRILGKQDTQLLIDHIMALDSEARRDRFNGAVSSEWVKGYAQRCIAPGTLVIAAESENTIIGVAELHPSGHLSGELAFSVLSSWRGKGIGAALFANIVEAAWSRGLDQIEITTHSDNDAMKQLARRFGAEIRFDKADAYGRIMLDEVHLLDSQGKKRDWVAERAARDKALAKS